MPISSLPEKLPATSPLIIGGGVAGLTTAVHLAERGLKPLLLEADPVWLGGRLKSGPTVEIEHQGKIWQFPGEHGVHGIWSPYVNLKAILARHDILPAFVPAIEEMWIFGRGKGVWKAAMGQPIRYSELPAPFHYLRLFIRPRFLNMLTLRDMAALFRVFGSLISAMSIDPLAEQKSLNGMSLADFMAGWSPNWQSFFTGLARNALAHQPDQVPASGFIAFLRFYTLLRRDAWIFDYLSGSGGASIAEPLSRVALTLGTKIRPGARVTALNGPNPWQVNYTYSDQQQSLETQHVILAVDAPAAKKLLGQSPATVEATRDLWFPEGISTAIIRLWFTTKPHPIAESGIFTGDFIMDNFFWLHRLQKAYEDWGQQTGGSALEMHIYGPEELLAQPNASLLARVIMDTYRVFPELRGHLLHSALLRNEATHTLFSVGEPGRHLGIETPWPNLFACGDWVYHPAPALYLERAAITGIAAANALLGQLSLAPWPILPHPEPEWLAGKIEIGATWLRRKLTRRKTSNDR